MTVPLLAVGCLFSRNVSFATVVLACVEFGAAEFRPSFMDFLAGFVLPFAGP